MDTVAQGIDKAWKGGKLQGRAEAFAEVALYCIRLQRETGMTDALMRIASYCEEKMKFNQMLVEAYARENEAEALSRA